MSFVNGVALLSGYGLGSVVSCVYNEELPNKSHFRKIDIQKQFEGNNDCFCPSKVSLFVKVFFFIGIAYYGDVSAWAIPQSVVYGFAAKGVELVGFVILEKVQKYWDKKGLA